MLDKRRDTVRIEVKKHDAVLKYCTDKMKQKYYRTVLNELPRLARLGPGIYHLHTDRGDIAITTTITD